MRIVRQISFEAKNDADAIRIAGERLGRDAVILSTRPAKVGGFLGFFKRKVLIVTAGVFEEEKREELEATRERLVAFQRLIESHQSPSSSSGGTQSPEVKDKIAFSSEGLALAHHGENTKEAEAASIKKEEKTAEPQEKLHMEVTRIYEKLDRVLERLDDYSHPVVSEEKVPELVYMLTEKGMDSELAQSLGNRFKREQLSQDLFPEWLAAQIQTAATTPVEAIGGQRVMFIGPTGVGKTTTIAKIAAIHALWEHKKVLLLTSDTYRIAAVEQLRTYAKILGVPIEVIFDAEDIEGILHKYKTADLILLDTAGRSQKDTERFEELQKLYKVFQPDALHLVLASNMKNEDMRDVVSRMGCLPLSHILFTKLDETTNYGCLLNILLTNNIPVSFLATGQNVPNDIEVANSRKMIDLFLGEGETLGA
ncbi:MULTISPECIES: flagellar biosynthesis protein FlhF [Aminobacterium]|jgi:flagellar biosynthesis protein FlhF|uniref:flagellar biosynthesis protein FlhF n=1 Tax=Aminobacterium TaxID=81466 RepID=UPI00257C3C0D|nr:MULTISPECIES: flagellar biosynthesis protein FlhF [unclassified Aminobacterium]